VAYPIPPQGQLDPRVAILNSARCVRPSTCTSCSWLASLAQRRNGELTRWATERPPAPTVAR
jgi:hypothetical protein